LHSLASSFILGYHGCHRAVAEKLLAGTKFTPSENEYDWLGPGIYFWEANPLRGMEFAEDWKKRGKIQDPYVVGAIVELGFCLDLTTSTGLAAVKAAYADFIAMAKAAGKPIPRNRLGPDRLLRDLDCAVINHLHWVREQVGDLSFETVKAVFIEGDEIYPEAGFKEKTHIQVCVRNLDCVKGVFRVPDEHLEA